MERIKIKKLLEQVENGEIDQLTLEQMFDELTPEVAVDFKNVFSENFTGFFKDSEETMLFLGEAYGQLGIQLDDIPLDLTEDTDFIYYFLSNFTREGIIGEKDLRFYKDCIEKAKRTQTILLLRREKAEQQELQGREQKITEAVDLVNREQGQQLD